MPDRFWSFCVCLALPFSLSAQSYRVDTVAGAGTFGGDGGPATAALVSPGPVVVNGNGIVYVADNLNYRIRRIDNAGNIATLIGRGYGTFDGDNGPVASAGMTTGFSLALDAAGNLYFTDDSNRRIRVVTAGGTVLTIAGNGTAGPRRKASRLRRLRGATSRASLLTVRGASSSAPKARSGW